MVAAARKHNTPIKHNSITRQNKERHPHIKSGMEKEQTYDYGTIARLGVFTSKGSTEENVGADDDSVQPLRMQPSSSQLPVHIH